MTDTSNTPVRRLLHWLATEPFVHFVLLGACIFVAYGMWGPDRGGPLHIAVSQSDQEGLRAMARQQWGKDPDAAQMRLLIDRHIREEVMYREALALELQRDDAIVRRRLVQKMEYLSQDDTSPAAENVLRNYFTAHYQEYAAAAAADLQLVYFDPGRRGKEARADALLALGRVQANNPVPGDLFMLGSALYGQTASTLERDFGPGFAQALTVLPIGIWSGPIESVHGWHLVRVTHRQAAPVVRFEDVRDRVASDQTRANGQATSDAAYARLRERYTIEVQGTTAP